MNKKLLNYIKFGLSMMLMGLGIALVTKSNLGTSAVSSLPFVLSKLFSLSFGMFTLLLNALYVLIQIIALNKKFPKEQYLQFMVGPLLGFFIDFWMYIFIGLNPLNYLFKLIVLLIGCIVIGLGVYGQLAANVVNNPMEGIVKLISVKTKIEFSKTKMLFDGFLVLLAAIISFTALGEIIGIREGTLISAFMVGYVLKILNGVKRRLET